MDIFYNMHFYRALRNTDTRNNWCPRCVPCLQRGIVPYEIIWWVKYKLTFKVHMRGYKFSWCILILDDTPLWRPITHVDCAMQQGHSVKWDRFVSTPYIMNTVQCKPDISRLVGSKQWYRDISESAIYRATVMSPNQAPFTNALWAIMGLFHV